MPRLCNKSSAHSDPQRLYPWTGSIDVGDGGGGERGGEGGGAHAPKNSGKNIFREIINVKFGYFGGKYNLGILLTFWANIIKIS